ncbi:phosphoenolpyruvate--protein phosphotransferase [Salinicoccus halitifaciens]|uniref:Phosphoenolpyruvate-protein phosphotransferase n=1 Tax=Salinicoccus halitifaciens TaxID=1073415 RepID=A0ABV2E7N7_9STAP|nr:phosphoenolpyruvate--protein phosphotransferase [Salinicoccus halitifaciens]MCD2136516.1 phosphoenolpyruvate--protein phosphotransferase [Salinicoccus halitifaciens]
MSKILKGIGASDGIAISKAYSLVEPDLNFTKTSIDGSASADEVQKFKNSLHETKVEVTKIRNYAEETVGPEHAAIFEAHLMVLDDPEFVGPIEEKITGGHSAPQALVEVRDQYLKTFEEMDNEYMRERAADIKDVSKRLLAHLLGRTLPDPASIDEEVIIVADDLTPSDTAQLDKRFVKGFVTNAGGRTSHSAIMARSLEIPAVVGTKEVTSAVNDGDIVIVDGTAGDVIAGADEKEIKAYELKTNELKRERETLLELKDDETETQDGITVELGANIGTPDDVEGVLANGAEGIGLFRTEFLYMGRDKLPTEDEQYEAYKTVLEKMDDKPVVVRTIDIGGDKEVPALDMPKELNPFLGYRAIRMALGNKELFRTQLRALLRASVHGNLKIMFPMIATIQEFEEAKALLIECRDELKADKVDVKDDIETGIMVEIPSAAILADEFAKVVDFFSIGTNDLIQYTFAADRMNENVSYLYQPYHPALLRLIDNVVKAAHREDKWVGMCGEMAGDSTAMPLLIGLGLDELSMSAGSVLKARSQIKNLKKTDMEHLVEAALRSPDSDTVTALVKEYTERL